MESGAQIVLSGFQLVLAGLGIGILMAAPVGPVNVLVIQRALSRGFWGGLAAGIGAVIGDGLLAAIAAFSVTAISDVITTHQRDIQVAGGALLTMLVDTLVPEAFKLNGAVAGLLTTFGFGVAYAISALG